MTSGVETGKGNANEELMNALTHSKVGESRSSPEGREWIDGGYAVLVDDLMHGGYTQYPI